jgi:hypothetical protein
MDTVVSFLRLLRLPWKTKDYCLFLVEADSHIFGDANRKEDTTLPDAQAFLAAALSVNDNLESLPIWFLRDQFYLFSKEWLNRLNHEHVLLFAERFLNSDASETENVSRRRAAKFFRRLHNRKLARQFDRLLNTFRR